MRNIVVVGAGFGGLRVAKRLLTVSRHSDVQITVIDQHAYHTLRPKLPEAIGGRIRCAVQVPLEPLIAGWRKNGAQVRFVHSDITAIDRERKVVVTSEGEFAYWRLVMATGSQSARVPIPGFDLVLPVWNFDDACTLRRRTGLGVQMAKSGKGDQWMKFAVIGGGFVGIEVAAELSHRLHRLAKEQGVSSTPKVTLIEMAPRLLPRLSASTSAKLAKELKLAGVSLRLGAKVHEVTVAGAQLENELIEAGTVIWAGGTQANEVLTRLGVADKAGRISTKSTLQALNLPGVYALGDAAYVEDLCRPGEPSAHAAIVHGDQVARNIRRELVGLLPHAVPESKNHYAISTGKWHGILAMHGAPSIAGPAAPMVKQAVVANHLVFIGGFGLLRRALPSTFIDSYRAGAGDKQPLAEGRVCTCCTQEVHA